MPGTGDIDEDGRTPCEADPEFRIWRDLAAASGNAMAMVQVRQLLLDLHRRVSAQEDRLAGVEDRLAGAAGKTLEQRLDALQAAREHIAGLANERPNERGYADRALSTVQRLQAERELACYLLGEEQA
jgi:exonuclease VII large subunit